MEYVYTSANPYAFYNAKDNYGLIEKDESKSKLIICYDKEVLKEIKEKRRYNITYNRINTRHYQICKKQRLWFSRNKIY